MPARKRFTFKIYDSAGNFLKATEDWDFSRITREANGSMLVDLSTDILTRDVGNGITDLMNQVTITVSGPNTPAVGIDYFSGYIPQQQLQLKSEEQRILVNAYGWASRLSEIIYRNGTTILIDKTAGVATSDLAKDIIDKVIAADSTFPVNYSATSVTASGDTIKDKFKLMTAGDALRRCILLAYNANVIWYWIVKGDKIFYFKQSSSTPDHSFTYGKDVTEFPALTNDLLQSRNEIFVEYNGGANVKRVADATSAAAYGLRSMNVNETNVPDATTATAIGNALLQIYKPPLYTVQVTINADYVNGIENIDPGQTCQIMNLPPAIASRLGTNMFITKTIYQKDSVILELSLKQPLIENSIEKLRASLNQTITDPMSASTYG
jgi:hypothetical protein